MTDYQTLRKHETEFGNHSFVEISRMLARNPDETTDKGSEFITIKRGYLDETGRRRIKNSVTLPNDPALVGFVSESLRKV